jgi:lambda repressor-like predicted transcriptional regulator
MIRCDYTRALTESFKYAKSNGMTLRQIAIKAGVTENTINNAKKGRVTNMTTWAAVIMACGYIQIICVLIPKGETL